jgi:RNA polymerase sigma factor (sigma-70 family)
MADDTQTNRAEWIRTMVDEHEGPLVRYATRIIGELDAARDVVQVTFIRLCREEPPPDRPKEWLFTVCRNKALDILRREKRMNTFACEKMNEFEAPTARPSAAIEKRETAGDVRTALDALPVNQQEVIRLKFECGMSYQEISRITSLSVTNVGFLIHTALKNIRRTLVVERG